MTVLVVMGVAGCGKSSVADLLSARLGWSYMEGDSLHPDANIAKMESGQPLTDEDRWPWLEKVAAWIEGQHAAGHDGLITCSALKRSYRDVLNRRGEGMVFVYLAGERLTLEDRMRARVGHFMPPGLLASQLATLEEPQPDEPSIRVPIEQSLTEIVEQVMTELEHHHR